MVRFTFAGICRSSFDESDYEITICFQTFLLCTDTWPEAEETRDGLFVSPCGCGFEFGAEGLEEDVPEFGQELRWRLGLLWCWL